MRQPRAPAPAHRMHRGFTLIELIVVLAIVALLASIVAPRYFKSVERAREATLRTSLNVMRDAIDKFMADQGRYPGSLEELAQRRYLRGVPDDPLTGRNDTWVLLPPPEQALDSAGVADVRSGASGQGSDGQPYQSY
ncbi:MAG: type II secretion system protein [Pseudomonadota bacterium]